MTTSPRQTYQPKTKLLLRLLYIFGAITLIFCIRYLLANPIAPDSWLHFGIGRYILEHKYFPHHTDISYKISQPIFEWIPANWLSDVFLYIMSVNLVIGPPLVIISVLLFTIWIIHMLNRRLVTSPTAAALSVVLVSILSLPFWKLHPLLFLTPLTLLLVYIFSHWNTSKNPNELWLLSIIMIIWTNIGGGFLFIPLLLIIAYITQYVLSEKHKSIRVIAPILTSITVTLINPNGIRLWIYNITVIGLLDSRKWYSTLAGALEATNTSIIKNAPSTSPYVIVLMYLLVTLFSLGYILVTDWKSSCIKLRPVLPTAILCILPFLWIRFIPIGLIPTIPLSTMVLWMLIDRWNYRWKRLLPLLGGILGAILLLCLVLLPINTVSTPPSHQLDMILQYHLPKAVLVSTDLVGYTYARLYPDKGFIDAQDDMFDENDSLAIYSQYSVVSETQVSRILDTYPSIGTVLLTKDNDYLTGYFNKQPDWTLVYLEYNGVMFVKNSLASESFLKDHALSAIDLTTDLGADTKAIPQAITQLENFTHNYPDSTLAIGQLASLYRVSGKLDLAMKTIQRIPQAKRTFVVKTEMGRILAAMGDCADAERFFLDALGDRNETNVSKTTFDLAILYAICMKDIPKAQHYFKRYTSYPIPQTERERATEIMKRYVTNLELETPP